MRYVSLFHPIQETLTLVLSLILIVWSLSYSSWLFVMTALTMKPNPDVAYCPLNESLLAATLDYLFLLLSVSVTVFLSLSRRLSSASSCPLSIFLLSFFGMLSVKMWGRTLRGDNFKPGKYLTVRLIYLTFIEPYKLYVTFLPETMSCWL